jgi:alanine dehydrogenase
MIIGVPREIKDSEFRVGLVPAGVRALVEQGHRVLVELSAGVGSGISDDRYAQAGAKLLSGSRELFAAAEMLVKVKEPLPLEYELLRAGQIVFTFFHFGGNRDLTEAMLARKIVALAYETITAPEGRLPILEPMSEIAGRLAVQEGAHHLEKPRGGKGKLLGGVPGVPPGRVLILGGGTVGMNAAKIAAGLKAQVTIMDTNLRRLQYLDDTLPANVDTLFSTRQHLAEELGRVDLVIGAVLLPGHRTPRLVTREMLGLMAPGTVVVDVAIDQGGCFETSRPTTHQEPTFVTEGVLHYCVANMPGAVPQTSTAALTNASLGYILQIAEKGYARAARENPHLAAGLNLVGGAVTNPAVADSFGLAYTPWEQVVP